MTPEDLLLAAMDALPDAPWCAGRAPITGEVVVVLPDATALAPASLAAHSEVLEPAPFGDDATATTRVDDTVRQALRLRARGAASVRGFDLAAVVRAIEAGLPTDRPL